MTHLAITAKVKSMSLARPRALLLAAALSLVAPAGFAPAPAAARDAPASFADLAEQLLPAVVNISSTTTIQPRADRGGPGAGPEMPNFPPGSPFEQFFRDFMERNRQGGGQNEPPRRSQSLGSGFIIDTAGLVVTNNHVIDGADEITVILQDNTKLKAKLVGRDERTDIAVLRVETKHKLVAVNFGDSDASRVGDWVLAIGNPFGLGGTVTAGIVSARGRDIRQGPYDDFIQTDAAINRGNSGGPLFNMNGEVIGINTAIYSPSGGSIGIGFSIPSNMAKAVVAQLRDFGHARRGWLGVRVQQVTPDIAESLGLKNPEGAMVAGVTDGSPAAKANIRNGDIILKFNGQDVKEMRTLPRIVAETEIGKSVPLTVWRDGKSMDLQVAIAELPDDQQAAAPEAKPEPAKTSRIADLGISLAPINDETRGKYQIGADQKGVVVTDVDAGAAADRGIKPGDIIVEVQQKAVNSPADVAARVADVRKSGRKSILILIQGQDGLRWVPVPLTDAGKKKPE
jgi:serine protease Do